MSVWEKFLGLFKKAEPKESAPVEDDMQAVEVQIRHKMEHLMQTIQNAHSKADGALTNKQIIDLVVAIDPIIIDLGQFLSTLNPDKDSSTIEEARSIYEENAYLRDVLLTKIKDFH